MLSHDVFNLLSSHVELYSLISQCIFITYIVIKSMKNGRHAQSWEWHSTTRNILMSNVQKIYERMVEILVHSNNHEKSCEFVRRCGGGYVGTGHGPPEYFMVRFGAF